MHLNDGLGKFRAGAVKGVVWIIILLTDLLVISQQPSTRLTEIIQMVSLLSDTYDLYK